MNRKAVRNLVFGYGLILSPVMAVGLVALIIAGAGEQPGTRQCRR